MPENRYKALEDYIRDILLPDVQYRIENWDQAERTYKALPVPQRLSLVTLTGWLLSYPITYVLPGHSRQSSGASSTELNDAIICDEGEEDEEQDNGRNALANQALVVTRVQLEPNENIEGLREHCMLSFSYPSDLAERCMDRSTPTPPSPLSPAVERDEYRFESTNESAGDSADTVPKNLSPRLPSSESFDQNRPLPFSNPDICAAGRSFLTELHSRFQKQSIWSTWQVGQQTVVLPVVAM
ncbi:hypothetical protein BGZ68_005030 [Mortierella alpina]|nr:hypothetical protein BGZ68_005030 [Mortierella alpina]